MGRKKRITLTYEFDSPQIKASWNQIMRENAEGMAVGLKKILQEVEIPSDPKIYLKEDLVVVKTINTDKGYVLTLGKDGGEELISKPYKLIADNEKYLTVLSGQIIIWFRRTGGVDHQEGHFDNIDFAVQTLKDVVDPIDRQKEIDRLDAEWKEKHPEEEAKVVPIEAAVPKV